MKLSRRAFLTGLGLSVLASLIIGERRWFFMPVRWSDFRQTRGSYSAIIYLDNGKVIAEDAQGNLIHISDDLGETFNEAVKQYPYGKIVIDAGVYPVYTTLKPEHGMCVIGAGKESTVLKLGDNANTDVIVIDQKNNVKLIGFSVDGNKTYNTSGRGIVVKGKTWRTVIADVTVRNCKYDNIIFTSDTSDYNYEPIMVEVESKWSDVGNGIVLSWTTDLFGWNIYSEGNAGAGVWCSASAITIYHLHVHNNYGPAGIVCDKYSSNVKLIDPWFDTNHQHGCLLNGYAHRICGGYAFNNGTSSAGTYSGIHLEDCTYTWVTQVFCTDTQSTKTQLHGIEESGSSDWNIISDNICIGNINDSIPIVGTHTFSDQHIYTYLPTDGFVTKKPVIYYDGTYYYLAVWDGSVWRKIQLS